ncbi:Orn/Lys/Arg family decarboxylase [Streptomyces sp. NPDC001781]
MAPGACGPGTAGCGSGPLRGAPPGQGSHVPAEQAAGRTATGTAAPYPPGIPAVLPGERLTGPVPRHPVTGVRPGGHGPPRHGRFPRSEPCGWSPTTAHAIECFVFQDEADGYPHIVVHKFRGSVHGGQV